ncbi:LysR substrate-binding domain-containing protein [Gammaproteobacteria bacterium AS21]
MDIRFLRSLMAVIDSGSIAGAARSEKLTAAAISQRIKTLENTLGCSLLTRSGHSAKPTDDCLRILPRLQEIARQVEQIRSDLNTTTLTGVLNIGVISSVLSGLLPRCIKYLTLQAPNILLKITPGSSAELYQKMLAKKIDLAIVVSPAFNLPKVVRYQHLLTEPLVLISAHAQHCIEDALKQQAYIQYDQHSWGGAITRQYLVDNKLAVNLLCEIDSLESIVLMVKQQMAVSLVPQWEGLSKLAPELATQIINDSKYQRNICLLSHRQAGKDKLIKAFENAVAQSLI